MSSYRIAFKVFDCVDVYQHVSIFAKIQQTHDVGAYIVYLLSISPSTVHVVAL